MLLYAGSNGRVKIYEQNGDELFDIISKNWHHSGTGGGGTSADQHNAGNSYVKTFFLPPRNITNSKQNWRTELVLINHSGIINSFLISATGYQELAYFDLSTVFPSGVTDAVYSSKLRLLFVSGPSAVSDIACVRFIGRVIRFSDLCHQIPHKFYRI